MSKRRLLTLNDLYTYYSSQPESIHFNAEKEKQNIVVQVEGKIKFEDSTKDTEGLMPVILQSCHTNLNVNGSYISEESMNSALPSFSNRPILGYIHSVNGQYEFYSHNMHLDENDELVYDEIPVGIIPESCDAKLEYDKEKDKTYCVVKGYIFEEYSRAAEILQREEECSVSVELSIRELSYNAKEKYLNIEDFFFSGVTILGKTEEGNDVKPGMQGSNIRLADFSEQNNSLCTNYSDELLQEIKKLNENLSLYNKEKSKEGGQEPVKFEELLEKYGKTVEDVTFEYENMTDEELEAKFEEVFGEDDTAGEGGNPETASEDDNVDDVEGNDEGTDEPEVFENIVRTFEISHDDIRWGLYKLLEPYEEADNAYYYISAVYDTYFVYENWSGDKIFGQKYTKDNDEIAFSEERYNLHKELLTDAEYAELTAMRSNYAEIKSQLEKYQEKEQNELKDALFTSGEYSSISDKSEFEELKNNHKEFSLEELKTKLDSIILEYAKKNSLKFSVEEPEVKQVVNQTKLPINTKTNKKNRYGSLKFN